MADGPALSSPSVSDRPNAPSSAEAWLPARGTVSSSGPPRSGCPRTPLSPESVPSASRLVSSCCSPDEAPAHRRRQPSCTYLTPRHLTSFRLTLPLLQPLRLPCHHVALEYVCLLLSNQPLHTHAGLSHLQGLCCRTHRSCALPRRGRLIPHTAVCPLAGARCRRRYRWPQKIRKIIWTPVYAHNIIHAHQDVRLA